MTIKQKLFVKSYLPVMGNGAEAARRAGYSDKCAKEIAYQLRQNPVISNKLETILRQAGLW